MEWYYVWWPWLTTKCVARVCQHQLSFLFLYRNELYYCCCWYFHVFCLTSVFSRDRIRLGWRPWMSANDFRGHLPICWRDLSTAEDSWYEKIKEQINKRINQQSKKWMILIICVDSRLFDFVNLFTEWGNLVSVTIVTYPLFYLSA